MIYVIDHNDTTRTVTTYDETGAVTSTRPYTTEENAAADAAEAAALEATAQQAKDEADRAALDALAHLSATAHTDGQPWTQPAGAHDAYPLGAEVTHNGSTWTSLTPFNVWTPGESGWRQKTTNGPAAWVQPTGAHDAYPAGAEVTHHSQAWRSTVDANVWEPGNYGWTPITQE